MFFRYKVERTGETFIYSNTNNNLYKEDLTPIIQDKKGSKQNKDTGSLGKTNAPKQIRISMGKTCNFSCSYCLQDGLSDKQDIEIDEDGLTKFIKDLENLDLSQLDRVELWGGEPFIYWNMMVQLLQSKLDREGVVWYICTNGSMLSARHLDFLDTVKGFVAIGISHDGPGQNEMRGKCPLDRLVPLLQRMDERRDHYGYGFQVTLSQENCDVYRIQGFFAGYMEKFGLIDGSVTYVPVESYDELSFKHSIHGEMLDVLRGSIKQLLDLNMKDFKSGNKKNLMNKHDLWGTGNTGVFHIAKSLKQLDEPELASRCGIFWDKLISVDIQGNVLSCPHVGADTHNCGTLENLEEARVVNTLFHKDYGVIDCASCPVKVSCHYGCPLDLPDPYRIRGCDVMYSFFSELYLSTFKMMFDSEITYLGAAEDLNAFSNEIPGTN